MTATKCDSLRASLRLRWRRWLAVVLLGSAAGVGCWMWFRPPPSAPPLPPEIPSDADESPVRAAFDAARAKILHNPSSGQAWGFFGEVLLAHSYEVEAIPCFIQAEHLDRVDPRWPYFLGGLLRLSDAKTAVVHLKQAVERLGPREKDNSAPRSLLAEVLLGLDDLEEAEEHFRHVLAAEPNNVRARYGLGLAAYSRGDLAESRRLLSPCVENLYTRRKACAQLATICQRLGDERAAADFAQKIQSPGEDYGWIDPYADEFRALAVGTRSRFQRAERLEQQGQFREAVEVFGQIAQDTGDRRSLIALGVSLSKAGDQEEAEKVLRRGLAEAAPSDPASYLVTGCYFLSLVLYQKGESLQRRDAPQAREVFAESSSWARKALVYKPDHAVAHLYLGLSLQQLGQRREALAALRQAVACAPGLTDAHLHLGEALAEEGLRDEASSELLQAMRLARKDDPRPAAALARLKRDGKGQDEGAHVSPTRP